MTIRLQVSGHWGGTMFVINKGYAIMHETSHNLDMICHVDGGRRGGGSWCYGLDSLGATCV